MAIVWLCGLIYDHFKGVLTVSAFANFSGYPQFWVDTAIPYGQLKKCLKKIQQELDTLGLEPETLRQLLDSDASSPQGRTVPLAKYKLACKLSLR
jgi:hypothetical protein